MTRAHASVREPLRRRGGLRRAGAIRALVAGSTLAALVAAPPVALVAIVGNPLPGSLPSLEALRGPISDEVLVNALAIAIWIVWAQFTVAAVLELHSALWGLDRPARLPAGRAAQMLAHRLVAGLLATGAAGASMSATAAWAALPVSAPPAMVASTEPAVSRLPMSDLDDAAVPAAVECRLYAVMELDTLWGIAERCLGDGLRYKEIAALNRDLVQPDGRRLTDEDLIYPGWLLAIPTEAAAEPAPAGLRPVAGGSVVTVREGDTLWDITAGLLGPGATAADIAAAWPRLYAANVDVIGSDPDLIFPGQRFGAPPFGTMRSTAAPPVPKATPGPGPSQIAPGPEAAHTAPASTDAAPTEAAPTEATPAPALTVAVPEATPSASDGPTAPWRPAGYGALTALAIVAALYGKRIAQQRRRLPGERIRMPADGVTEFELMTSAAADAPAADLLDRTLRTFAHNARAMGRPLPELTAVKVTASGVFVHLADPVAPLPPFEATAQAAWWFCGPDAELLDPDSCAEVAAPYPALVTVGHTPEGAQLLIDLEAVREITVEGPPDHAIPILRALAVELSAARLADDIGVTLVGFGRELVQAGLASGALRVADDLEAAVRDLEGWARRQADALAASGQASVREARSKGRQMDAWTPHVLLTAVPPDDAQAMRLAAALAMTPATSLVAVTARPITARPLVLPATTGVVPIGKTGHRATVQRLDDRIYRELVAHLNVAAEAAVTVPAEMGPAGAGSNPEEGAAGLDDDDQRDHPEIRVLGPVELVSARGEAEPGKVSRLTEIVAFLALHPGAGQRDFTRAIWPGGTSMNNRNTYMSKARALLGTDADGEPYLPYVEEDNYALSPRVRCDWLRFKRLAQRGLRDRGPVGTADLERALALVRGQPFATRGSARYGWAEALRQEMVALIVDVAAALASYRLAAGDLLGADLAAQAGLGAAPVVERLWRIRFMALYEAGEHRALDRAIQELDRLNEASALDMEEETIELLRRLATGDGFRTAV